MQCETGVDSDRLELKYCELCGGLWLRGEGDTRPYCGLCARWIERDLPPATRKEA